MFDPTHTNSIHPIYSRRYLYICVHTKIWSSRKPLHLKVFVNVSLSNGSIKIRSKQRHCQDQSNEIKYCCQLSIWFIVINLFYSCKMRSSKILLKIFFTLISYRRTYGYNVQNQILAIYLIPNNAKCLSYLRI